MSEKSSRILSHAVKDQISRILLRMVPFPGSEILDLTRSLTKANRDLDAQVDEAFDALKRSSNLVGTLEAELKKRADKLEKLQSEHKRLSELSEITEEQVSALAQQIEITIGKSKKWDWIVTILLNVFAGLLVFVLGVALSDSVTGLLAG